MKFMLIFASAVALAVASPHRAVVDPGAAGPAPVPDFEPIAVGPAVLEFEPIAVGPEIMEQPVVPAPAPVLPEGIAPPVAPVPVGNPIVQIILNINGQHVSVPGIVAPQPPIEVIPQPPVIPAEPVHIVDSAPEPVEIGPAIVPEPVAIGVPLLPYPAAILPDDLN